MSKNRFAVMVSVCLVSGVYAEIGDINVCTNICAGNNISCKNQYLNCGSTKADSGSTLGDLLNSSGDDSLRFYDWKDLKEARLENLGLIKNTMNYMFSFPANGQKKIISFTPTEGALSGHKIRLLLVSFDLNGKGRYPKNTPKELSAAIDEFKSSSANQGDIKFQSMIRIFGNVEGGSTLWYDTGAINIDFKPDMKGFDLTMSIEKDGEVTINDKKLLDQTGVDGAKARIAPINLNFSNVPEMVAR